MLLIGRYFSKVECKTPSLSPQSRVRTQLRFDIDRCFDFLPSSFEIVHDRSIDWSGLRSHGASPRNSTSGFLDLDIIFVKSDNYRFTFFV